MQVGYRSIHSKSRAWIGKMRNELSRQRRNFRGDGGSGPPPPILERGTDPLTFLDHLVSKYYKSKTRCLPEVYSESMQDCSVVSSSQNIYKLPSSQFWHAIAMVPQPQHLLAFSNKCSNIQCALRYRWVTVGANIGIISFCIIYVRSCSRTNCTEITIKLLENIIRIIFSYHLTYCACWQGV